MYPYMRSRWAGTLKNEQRYILMCGKVANEILNDFWLKIQVFVKPVCTGCWIWGASNSSIAFGMWICTAGDDEMVA